LIRGHPGGAVRSTADYEAVVAPSARNVSTCVGFSDQPPFALFICQDEDQRRQFLTAADLELTGHRSHPSAPSEQHDHVAADAFSSPSSATPTAVCSRPVDSPPTRPATPHAALTYGEWRSRQLVARTPTIPHFPTRADDREGHKAGTLAARIRWTANLSVTQPATTVWLLDTGCHRGTHRDPAYQMCAPATLGRGVAHTSRRSRPR